MEVECPSGKFLYVAEMEKGAETAVDTSVFLLNKETFKKWGEKGLITAEGRLFCIHEELEVEEETQVRYRIKQKGKVVLESVVV
jgi:hypothetical protein